MKHADLLARLRRQRDEAAARGDHAMALILNDRVKDLKEGRTSVVVENVMVQFESALARQRFYSPPKIH